MKQDIQEFEITTNDTNLAYIAYKKTISQLIAYVEVYEHDLPSDIMAQTAELFQNIALYELDVDKNTEKSLEQTTLIITQSLYKHSISLFIKKIREYKKTFKRFKYKGVSVDGRKFCEMAKESESDICKEFSLKLRKYYKGNTLGTLKDLTAKQKLLYLSSKIALLFPSRFVFFKKEPFLPEDRFIIVEENEDLSLESLYSKTKELLEKYQEVFPSVVGNGTNQTLIMSVFLAISSWIIPALLSIPVIERIICTIKDCFS